MYKPLSKDNLNNKTKLFLKEWKSLVKVHFYGNMQQMVFRIFYIFFYIFLKRVVIFRWKSFIWHSPAPFYLADLQNRGKLLSSNVNGNKDGHKTASWAVCTCLPPPPYTTAPSCPGAGRGAWELPAAVSVSACWALGSWPGSSLAARTCNGNHTWLEFSLLNWTLPYRQSQGLSDWSLFVPAITPGLGLAC